MTHNRLPLAFCLSLCTATLLSACGGSDGDDPQSRGRFDIDYSNLRWDDPALEPLTNQHAREAVEEYLRNGVRLQAGVHTGGDVNFPGGVAEDTANDADAPEAGDYSQTNVHVEGVDEADRLKYDGRHLFVAESPQYSLNQFVDRFGVEVVGDAASDESEIRQALSIYRTQPEQATAEPLARYDLMREEDSPVVLSQLYLQADDQGQAESVLALSDSRMIYGGWGWASTMEIALYQGRTRVEWVDVRSPANPVLAGSIEVEGSLLNSRKIGNVLYLVSRSNPYIPEVEPYATDDGVRENNERLIQETALEELLPGYRLDDGERQPLVTEADCYLPRELEPGEGYTDIVTISAFDATTREKLDAVCINARLSGVYMSLESLYLASQGSESGEPKTAVHKFATDAGTIAYRGTGLVPGGLGGSDPAFRMDEEGGFLRLVTSDWSSGDGVVHKLHVLHEDEAVENELAVVAQLPNEAQPSPIGKPGENIYAVRFFEDRAYVVTFRQIDPLYVIDVSDPLAPSVLGELEIPGVSDYLHPVDGDYLISVGRSASQDGLITGLKVELFDVRDALNPMSVADIQIGDRNSWSEALVDLKAFNAIRASDDELRFTLPASRYVEWEWLDAGLHLFSVSGLTGEQAQLNAVEPIIVETAANSGNHYPRQGGSGRSRLHGDTVYYLHGNDVWARFWDQPGSLQGPFSF